MTEMTDEQRQQVEVVAERVATKLHGFFDTLPADERAVLAVTLAHNLGGASEEADDGAGYAAQAVAEAFTAQEDVSGYAILINGRFFPLPDRNPVPPTRVGVDGPTFEPRPRGRVPQAP